MTRCHTPTRNQPPVLEGWHHDTCPNTTWHPPLAWPGCPGCEPCPWDHCGTCRRRHVGNDQHTCIDCVRQARDDIDRIVELTNATILTDLYEATTLLDDEAETRGVNSEAAHLAGPTAHPAAWRQRRRHGYRPHPDDVIGENHPLWVLGVQDLLVAEHYDHHRTGRPTVASTAAYLKANLTDLAQDDDFPFDDLAADVKACRSHLEQVLRADEQRDTGAPCMNCGTLLVRDWEVLDAKGAAGWSCPRCRQTSTEDQYRFAVMHLAREEAHHLTDRDMEVRTGVKAGTVREWARRGHVSKRRDSGRTLYAVADVLDVARGKGLIA